jgi:SAM-dependent methyltransferase
MPDFSTRSAELEIIDGPPLDDATMARILGDLGAVNRWLGGYRTTLDALERLLPRGTKRARLLDAGAGGGDMARRLVAWGRERGTRVEVVSVDLSPGAVAFARDALEDVEEATVVRGDVLALPFADASFDVALSAPFLHHFDQRAAARVIRSLYAASRLGVVVNDLRRHPLAWAGIRTLTRLLPASPVVRNDGPLSVLRAFDDADLEELSRETGLRFEVRRKWAFRYQVVIPKGNS